MKINASIVTKSVLAIALAAGVSACNQNKTADKPAVTAGTTTSASTPEIVFINQDTLVVKYNYFTDMSKRLEQKAKEADADVQSRQQAIQREYAEYQKAAATMPADQRQAKEQHLNQKGQEFQQYRQNAGAQIQQDQSNEQTKFYEKIAAFTKAYAKEKGYKMVLTFTRASTGMLYGDPSLDVTTDVIKRLNDDYAKEKK